VKAELIDSMGSDDRVVDAARVSFDKIASNYTEEQNEKLLTYLAKHGHWTPFSHVMITMRETVPTFVARQRFKHMVGLTYNEVSRRYVSDEPEFFVPSEWRKAADNKKQGSSDEVITKFVWDHGFANGMGGIKSHYQRYIDECARFYNDMLNSGVAPEQARMVLPQSMYTSYYVTGSLAAWARAYKLRIDPHAQKEIQDLAGQWGEIIGSINPLQHSWKALTQ
jgi:thymidylate synthase (FAD)